MRNHSKALLVAVAAVLVLSLATSAASASRSIRVGAQSIRATSTSLTFTGGAITITCAATMSGSLHDAIAKARSTLVGYITEAATTACVPQGGFNAAAVTFLTGQPPYHIRYISFSGTLPNISSFLLLIQDAKILVVVQNFGFRTGCLYEAITTGIMVESSTPPRFNRFTFLENEARLITTLWNELGACSTTAEVRGSLRLSAEVTATLT